MSGWVGLGWLALLDYGNSHGFPVRFATIQHSFPRFAILLLVFVFLVQSTSGTVDLADVCSSGLFLGFW